MIMWQIYKYHLCILYAADENEHFVITDVKKIALSSI